ncbi:hypothetical protein Rhopal_000334-T1 [Rhodotorula paludigena]|uniref:DUF300-domain-containing protein n=1 Tax=Rhodotorula paludigena TaxID=86838 RepID=A0AAV5GC92_9BASI|nr:hypothetical protein Rhopal_000334-T1 [Rhodotorula paludigena]
MSSYFSRVCPEENTRAIEQSDFFDGRWDAHEIGWVIAGVTAAISTLITLISVWLHARNYYKPKEQRQILRILLMPAVYAVVSFFSYRFFRAYTYYSVSVVAYESLVLAAFLMLLLQYVGESSDAQKAVLKDKEKRKIPFPFWCIRFRPSKPYFLHALKWSVLQYSLLRPLISIIEIVCHRYGVLCPTQYSVYYAEVYLDAVDFVSISVALYGLIVWYALVKERLAGKRPLAKFLSIKIVVMLLFYQNFVFSVLASHGVIKETEYWTTQNVSDGLSALCVCCEMVIMSIVFAWAFSYKEYKAMRALGAKHTSVWRSILHSLNYYDFLREGWRSLVFSWNFIRRKPGTHAGKKTRRKQLLAEQKADKHVDNQPQYGLDFDAAFAGVDDSDGSPALSDDLSHFSTHEPKGSSVLPMTAFGRLPGTERRRSFSGDNYDPTYAPGDVGAHRSYDMEGLPSPVPIRETSRPPSRVGHTAVEMGERK